MHESPEKQAALEWYKNARFGMFIHWGAILRRLVVVGRAQRLKAPISGGHALRSG